MDALLGAPAEAMYSDLERRFNDGRNHVLHYVTAREMYNIIKAAEEGKHGDPNQFRDHVLKPPRASRLGGRAESSS